MRHCMKQVFVAVRHVEEMGSARLSTKFDFEKVEYPATVENIIFHLVFDATLIIARDFHITIGQFASQAEIVPILQLSLPLLEMNGRLAILRVTLTMRLLRANLGRTLGLSRVGLLALGIGLIDHMPRTGVNRQRRADYRIYLLCLHFV